MGKERALEGNGRGTPKYGKEDENIVKKKKKKKNQKKKKKKEKNNPTHKKTKPKENTTTKKTKPFLLRTWILSWSRSGNRLLGQTLGSSGVSGPSQGNPPTSHQPLKWPKKFSFQGSTSQLPNRLWEGEGNRLLRDNIQEGPAERMESSTERKTYRTVLKIGQKGNGDSLQKRGKDSARCLALKDKVRPLGSQAYRKVERNNGIRPGSVYETCLKVVLTHQFFVGESIKPQVL